MIVSYIETSMYWPRPVWARWKRAKVIAYAAFIPEAMSPRATPSQVGGPPACPQVAIRPPMA